MLQVGRVLLSAVLLFSSSLLCLHAQAQDTSPSPPPIPALPASNPPETPGPPANREAQLQDEVAQLKAMVRELSAKVDQLSSGRAPAGSLGSSSASSNTNTDAAAAFGDSSSPSTSTGGRAPGGGVFGAPEASAAGGGSAAARGPLESRRTSRFNMPGISPRIDADVIFGPGFQIQTADEEFQLQFHDLTQADGRFYTRGQQTPITSTFLIPREWYIFSGRLTKPFEYYASIAEGIDSLNILDVFLNINYDKRLQFKIGRYKTPFTYEFYNLPINAFVTPERSLFFNNFGLNRDIGLMAWGTMFDNRLDYALGIFNGTRNGFVDANDFKDFCALVNYKPFANWVDHPLENLSFGGSTDTGLENNVPIPQVLRTNVATTGNLAIGPEFLAFNKNVMESGLRTFWTLYMAYYYQRLSLIGEWESGYDSYAMTNQKYHTRVPVQSFYVMGGYFLTGERVSGRGIVKPLRDFDVRPGKRGPGAIELIARFNYLNIGREVFSAGLADPVLWTNQLFTTDLGVNWYLTQYVKIYMGWQHAGFGNPVSFAPDRFQSASDQYWLRFQVYF